MVPLVAFVSSGKTGSSAICGVNGVVLIFFQTILHNPGKNYFFGKETLTGGIIICI